MAKVKKQKATLKRKTVQKLKPVRPKKSTTHSNLICKVRREDKAKWVQAAGGKKLSQWVIETLNAAVE